MLNYNYMPLRRYLIAYSVAVISHCMSVFGSSSIIFLVLRDAKKRGEVYHRLVLGMSVADLLFSGPDILQGLLLPRETGMPFGIGNTRSCEVMGALTIVWMSAIIYNAVLCVYFLLAVRYGMRQRQVKAIIEPYGHAVAIEIPLLIIVACFATHMFNQDIFLGICTVAPYPANCLHEESVEIECIRGNLRAYHMITLVHGSVNLVVGILGVGSTWLVYLDRQKPWRVKQSGILFSFLNALFSCALAVFLSVNSEKNLGTTGTSDHLAQNVAVNACVIIFYCMAPLQGFLNWLIYIRPRWIPWRDAYPDETRWWALCQVFAGSPTPVTRPTQHWLAVDSAGINEAISDDNDRSDFVQEQSPLDRAS